MPVPLRQTRRLTIDELCAAYDNEDAHTEHVTALALQLFDHTRAALDLPAGGRRLLETAGRLHDIGYSVDPVHHVQASTEIVSKEGIKGFRQSEREQIVQVMVRHSGRVGTSRVPAYILQLAAFLRIGDGLDYSHAQTARIASIRRVRQTIRVTVRSDVFPQCLTRADRKADLWRVVFPYNIQFVAAPTKKDDRDPLIHQNMRMMEAARRLMWIQFKTILINLDAAITGESIKPLHDIRVATRRMRTLLRVFRKHLPDGPRQEIEGILVKLSEGIAPVRDLDEWVNLLDSESIHSRVEQSRRFSAYLRHIQQRRQLAYVTVRRRFRGQQFASQRLKINRLLRVELPRLIKTEPPGSLPKLAAKQLDKALRRVRKHARHRHSTSSRKLHQLRISLRKARYLAEFFAPVLAPNTVLRLAKRLHRVERVLGRIHDLDLGMKLLQREGAQPPRAVAALFKQERQQNLHKLDKVWSRLTNPPLLHRVQHDLART